MPQNPPRFFAPRYFAPGYWGGEVAEGSVSASLLGTSAMSAVLTGVQSGYTGGSFYFKNRRFKVVIAQPKPAYIRANLAAGGTVTARPGATGALAAKINADASLGAAIAALAHGSAQLGGDSSFGSHGFTLDRYARARAEDELWLIAA